MNATLFPLLPGRPARLAAAVAVAAAGLAASGCEKDDEPASPEGSGRVSVVVSVDWEGAYLSPDGLDALDDLREDADVPLTHFVTPAYYTKKDADPEATTAALGRQLRPGEEIALHIHCWKSLVAHAGVEPRLEPSFLGDEPLMEFEDGDVGYEVELAAYEPGEIRSILASSRKLLTDAGFEVIPALRVGGTVATERVLAAARAEGLTVDASAGSSDVEEPSRQAFARRVQEVWPEVEVGTQPFRIDTPEGKVLEMPSELVDYMSHDEIVDMLGDARDKLAEDPDRDVFVDLVVHQETGAEFIPRLVRALDTARDRYPEDAFVFETKSAAIARARAQLGSKAK